MQGFSRGGSQAFYHSAAVSAGKTRQLALPCRLLLSLSGGRKQLPAVQRWLEAAVMCEVCPQGRAARGQLILNQGHRGALHADTASRHAANIWQPVQGCSTTGKIHRESGTGRTIGRQTWWQQWCRWEV